MKPEQCLARAWCMSNKRNKNDELGEYIKQITEYNSLATHH